MVTSFSLSNPVTAVTAVKEQQQRHLFRSRRFAFSAFQSKRVTDCFKRKDEFSLPLPFDDGYKNKLYNLCATGVLFFVKQDDHDKETSECDMRYIVVDMRGLRSDTHAISSERIFALSYNQITSEEVT
uniref:Uncharacterized protein n=1 Tax=Glossina pallidipes TaxID=7398 RepID=A0A1A9ZF14_GLOPL